MEATDGEDWRLALHPEARTNIVNRVAHTLTRHLPSSGLEALPELMKIATRFEEKTYTAAQSQSDYLRRIYLKMLGMESRRDGSNASSGYSFNAPPYDEY